MQELQRLRRLLLETVELRDDLDAVPPQDFLERVVALGAAHGCPVEREKVQAALVAGRTCAPMAMPDEIGLLNGFVPCKTRWIDGQLMVEWGYFGGNRFTEPFFTDTVQYRFTGALPRLLRLRTPISALEERHALAPGLPLAGLVFHASRCGSTLISRMLAALPELVVVPEPGPLDAVLRAHLRDRTVSDDMRIDWLRWMVSALGQARSGAETHLVLKLDAWSILSLPLIERAFPGVPWIFVYREPEAIIVSHLRRRGIHMTPGILEPELFGFDASSAATMAAEEYCARVLGCIGEAAGACFRPERARLIAYEELPAAVETVVASLFGLELTPAGLTRLRDVTRFHAKEPSKVFVDDTAAKRRDTTPEIKRAVERWVAPAWARLEELHEEWPGLSSCQLMANGSEVLGKMKTSLTCIKT